MNKTISVNLSGLLFNLEEVAFEKLAAYLNQLKKSFEGTTGKEEILADIESRIAELFTEKIQDKQVILEKEVDEVIEILGAPEQYETDDDTQSESTSGKSYTHTYYEETTSRRLFRDSENSVFGGVCSGVAHYFGTEAVWLRLAFVIALFFAGTGPLLYIILWIVIPKATTTAEKLQMRGERVNIENIEKRIKEEAERIKKKAGEFGDKAKNDLNSSNIGSRAGGFINEFIYAILNFLKSFGKVIGKTIGLFLLVIGGISLLAIIISFITSGAFIIGNDSGNFSIFRLADFLDIFFESGLQQDLFILGIILLLVTPVIGIILLGLRLIIYPRVSLAWPASVNGMLFIGGLLLSIVTAAMLINDFSSRGKRIDSVGLTTITSDTLSITVQPDSDLNIKQFATIDHWRFYLDDEEHFVTGNVRLNIEKSTSNNFGLNVTRTARGTDKKEAIKTASAIKYFIRQDKNIVYINPNFNLANSEKWRRQRLEFTLEMPVGKFVYLDKNLEDVINDIPNLQDMDDDEMAGHTWIMGEQGMSCVSCPLEEEVF